MEEQLIAVLPQLGFSIIFLALYLRERHRVTVVTERHIEDLHEQIVRLSHVSVAALQQPGTTYVRTESGLLVPAPYATAPLNTPTED